MNSWERAQVQGSTKPKTRDGHSSIVWMDSMFIFGGFDMSTGQFLNDMYKLSPNDAVWTEIYYRNPPSPRAKHSAVVYENEMYIYGGFNDDKIGYTSEDAYMDDVWKYDFVSRFWKKLHITGEIPNRRSEHTAVVDDHYMIVFGGMNNEDILNDVVVMNFKNLKWEILKCHGDVPTARCSHSACILDHKMFIFGGITSEDDGMIPSNDLYCLDLKTLIWRKVITTGDTPSPRSGQCGIGYGKYLIIFGGSTGTEQLKEYMNDLYSLNLQSFKWNRMNVSGDLPPVRDECSGVIIKDRLYIFGGQSTVDIPNEIYKIQLQIVESQQPIPQRQKQQQQLEDKIELDNRLFLEREKQRFSDIQIIVQDKTFYGHKCILCQSKPLLEIPPEPDTHRTGIYVIKITKYSAVVFQKVFDFLYLGKIELTRDESPIFVELLLAAREFELKELELCCLSQFDKVVHDDVLLNVLSEAYKNKLTEVVTRCFNIFVKSREKQLEKKKELSALDKDLMIELLTKDKLENVNEIKELKGVQNLQDHIKKLYQTKDYADVVLISSDNKIFKAHRVIMSAFSEYFSTLFSKEGAKALSMELKMEDMNATVIETVLELIYKNDVNLPSDLDSLLNIAAVSDKTALERLSKEANEKVSKLINADNACEVLQFCIELKLKGPLREKCLQEIKSLNNSRLLISLMESHSKKYAKFKEQIKLRDFEIDRLIDHVQALHEQVSKLSAQIETAKFMKSKTKFKREWTRKNVIPVSEKVLEQIRRLKGIHDPSEKRIYHNQEIPDSIQYFCDCVFPSKFSSSKYELLEIEFTQEFDIKNWNKFPFLKENPGAILIGDGDYIIAALMDDDKQDFSDFNIYIVDETTAKGPIKLSDFLESCIELHMYK